MSYKGRQIFYREALGGQEETILLLHGFPTASWDWHRMWPLLERQYNLLAPDFIGFGFSDKPLKYTYSIFDQADLVQTLLAEKGLDNVHLLAHDYGDTVAQELLARQMEGKLSLRTVCLLNGGLFSETHRPRPVQQLLLSKLGGLMRTFLNKKTLEKNFRQIFGPNTQPSQEEINYFWELIDYNNGKRIMHKLIRYMRERNENRSRWVSGLTAAQSPIRLINGPEDPISGAHMVDRYRELIPDADIVLLRGIGHYPNMEAPGSVVDYYLEFLQNQPLA